MKLASNNKVHSQRGAVLVISLIMLAVMTLFVVSMLKTSILELKIGGASQVAAINFSNAEFAINNFITLNNGLYAPGFIAAGASLNPPAPVFGGQVAVVPTELGCGPWSPPNRMQMGSGTLTAVEFNLRATATGTLGGETTVVQGVQSLAAAGACP
jgi:hypothetical protein